MCEEGSDGKLSRTSFHRCLFPWGRKPDDDLTMASLRAVSRQTHAVSRLCPLSFPSLSHPDSDLVVPPAFSPWEQPGFLSLTFMLSSKPLRWICTYFLVHLTLFIFITIVLYLSSLFFGHNCGIYHLCSLFWIVMFLTVNYILNPYNFTEEGEVEPHVAFRKIFKKG